MCGNTHKCKVYMPNVWSSHADIPRTFDAIQARYDYRKSVDTKDMALLCRTSLCSEI